MTITCIVAAAGYSIALALVLVGFFRVAVNLDAPVLCSLCIGIGAVEIAGGAAMWAGLMMVMGGYL